VRRYRELVLALVLEIVGAAGALLVATRTWQTISTPRPAPLHDDVLTLSGRDVDTASTALALVALAGVVAVLATRGLARRLIGLVVLLAGAGLVWRAVTAGAAVSARRARVFVADRHPTVDTSAVAVRVDVHGGWVILGVGCGVLVVAAGALIAWRGHRWPTMSARYDRRAAAPSAQARASRLWADLDRGDDPTSDPTDNPSR
jgi:uncharacterized membrane protein (TIGR02234 family)